MHTMCLVYLGEHLHLHTSAALGVVPTTDRGPDVVADAIMDRAAVLVCPWDGIALQYEYRAVSRKAAF